MCEVLSLNPIKSQYGQKTKKLKKEKKKKMELELYLVDLEMSVAANGRLGFRPS
jgi:hypothetical protein